jgi:hypothetical protein
MKGPTDQFLENLDKLCISEYVPSKIKINKEILYNENNIESVISNVEDYNKFIYELDKATLNSEPSKTLKDQDKNKNDIHSKILTLKRDLVPSSFFKTDIKNSYVLDFDDIIKNKAEEIVQKVNQIQEVLLYS